MAVKNVLLVYKQKTAGHQSDGFFTLLTVVAIIQQLLCQQQQH